MASSRVPDPPHQATAYEILMHTDSSTVQIKSHQLSLLLDELEQWATIVPCLSLDQRQKIRQHLEDQISQLATLDKPSGTRKQQLDEIERLAKLQRGPLCTKVDYGGMRAIMEDVVTKRLDFLSGTVLDDGSEVSRLVNVLVI